MSGETQAIAGVLVDDDGNGEGYFGPAAEEG
jgi:hypothetical protein